MKIKIIQVAVLTMCLVLLPTAKAWALDPAFADLLPDCANTGSSHSSAKQADGGSGDCEALRQELEDLEREREKIENNMAYLTRRMGEEAEKMRAAHEEAVSLGCTGPNGVISPRCSELSSIYWGAKRSLDNLESHYEKQLNKYFAITSKINDLRQALEECSDEDREDDEDEDYEDSDDFNEGSF